MTDFTSVIQFTIPRSVADAVNLETINARARAAGVFDPRLEYSDKNVRVGGYRITCRPKMAAFLVDEIVAIAETAQGQLVIDCAAAAKNALEAMKP